MQNTVVKFPDGGKKGRIPDLFPRVKAAALANAEELVPAWLPDGKRRGREWVARNPRRADRALGSFKVNLSTGKWADFATEDKGHDLIGLYAFVYGLRQIEAALELAGQLGIRSEEHRTGNGVSGQRQGTNRREAPRATTISAEEAKERKRQAEKSERERKEAAAKTAHRFWETAGAPEAMEVMQAYLEARGLNEVEPAVLRDCRVHPAVPYWHEAKAKPRKLGSFPALLFLVRDGFDEVVGLHRVYLSEDGSDKVRIQDPDNPWKTLPAKKAMAFGDKGIAGAAIRLTPEGEGREHRRLHVAEGPETALAVWSLLGGKGEVWSTISAQGMTGLKITPNRYKEIVIWADKDLSKAGQKAAMALAARLEREGMKVKVKIPKGDIPAGTKSLDWLDVLAARKNSRWKWFF